MKRTLFILILPLMIAGCAGTQERFSEGSSVEVTEWQILHGADGAKTLRGTLVNNSPYLVYDLELATQIYEGETLKNELKTEIPNLFPDTQTRFEILLPAGLEDPQPKFQYRFRYTTEEEFNQYRHDKTYRMGPLAMSGGVGGWSYNSPHEELYDSRRRNQQ